MATSLIGPSLTERAFAAAPVPRPPQPTRATWMVLFSPAYTDGIAMPARADSTVMAPDCFIISRRDKPLFVGLLTTELPLLVNGQRTGMLIQLSRYLYEKSMAAGRSRSAEACGGVDRLLSTGIRRIV